MRMMTPQPAMPLLPQMLALQAPGAPLPLASRSAAA